jgi:Flp pilus assembly protein TadD
MTARRDAVALGAIVLVALSPIAFLPGAFDRWNLPKLVVLAAACILAVFSVAAGRLPRWFAILVGVGAVLLAVAAVTGALPLAQLMGRWPRYEGLITLPAYVAAAWIGARLLGPAASESRRRVFVNALAVAAILAGCVSLLEAAGLRPISSTLARPGALFGNASDQGVVGVMLVAVLAVPAMDAWRAMSRPILPTVGVAFSLAIVVSSASRAAILVLGVVLIAFVVRGLVRRHRGEAIAAGAVLAISVAAVALEPLARSRVAGTSPLAADSVQSRLDNGFATAQLIAQHPLTGVGPSGYVDAIVPFHASTWAQLVGSNVTIDSPHDWLLQSAVAGGIPLLIVTIALAVVVAMVGVRRVRSVDGLFGTAVAVAAFAVMLLVHFTAPATTILASFLLGRLIAQPAAIADRVRWVVGVAIAAWTALLVTTTLAELPLGAGVAAADAGDLSTADAAFSTATALRSWDADTPSIAAQSFAGAADAGVAGAAELAVRWGTRAVDSAQMSVSSGIALAVGQQFSGDLEAARGTLERVQSFAPNDPRVAHRLGGILFLLGDAQGAHDQLKRATELDPENVEVWTTFGYVCDQIGDGAGAEQARHMIASLSR